MGIKNEDSCEPYTTCMSPRDETHQVNICIAGMNRQPAMRRSERIAYGKMYSLTVLEF